MRREACEARETRGMARDHFGEAIVRDLCQVRGGVGIEHLHAGGREQQELNIDAVVVHVSQALLLEVEQH